MQLPPETATRAAALPGPDQRRRLPLRPHASGAAPPRELELLLCAACTRLSPSDADRLRAMACAGPDWALVLHLARIHRLEPLLQASLNACGTAPVPGSVLVSLQASVEEQTRRNHQLTTELLELLHRFEAERIRVIPYRCSELAVLAYGDLSLRPIGDLDLLVQQRDAERAKAALIATGRYGLRRERSSWCHLRSDAARIDLYWKLGDPWGPAPGRFEELFERVRPVALRGGTVPALASEDLMLALAIDFARDWSAGRRRIVRICDVAELVRRDPNIDWALLLGRARAAGAHRMVLLHLRIAHELLGVGLPADVLARAQSERTLSRLARAVHAGLARDARPASEGARAGSGRNPRFQLDARERLRDKARYLLHAASRRMARA